MNVAVLTMTRDRIDYTKHCYQTLATNAGCDFDWYVVDQASDDGTQEWLSHTDATVIEMFENIGICPALNMLLDRALEPADYDVIVRWDNDCELLTQNTLRDVAEAADATGWILAPHVRGLLNPPPTLPSASLDRWWVSETTILGGIFMAIPSDLFTDFGYRYVETNPPWSGDEAITGWWRAHGGHCGYLDGYDVNHYLTTAGQNDDLPGYHERKLAEMNA
jgi:glycosyltransferase involved in cell wall biosynthesis